MADTRTHLHKLDCPDALAILDAMLGHRERLPDGYAPGEAGAEVDWEALERSYLSTSETAVIHLVQGIAMLERHGGGLPSSVRDPVRKAMEGLYRS
jgi:hypothetical protein